MKIKSVGIVGANGRMGQEVVALLKEKKITTIGLVRQNQKAQNCDHTFYISKEAVENCDVLIDFSSPEVSLKAAQLAAEDRVPFVSGTTGLKPNHIANLKKHAKKTQILWSPNMSLGVALLKNTIQMLRNLSDFDFQIVEAHHNKKKDSPSGTAIMLQSELQRVVNKKLPSPLSLRGGGIIGIHQVYAMGAEEFLMFEHQATHRRVFARGAVEAALLIKKLKPGFYQIEDLFK